jgi:hypothetical protein
MQLDWQDTGPRPTDAELDEFERVHGVRLTEEHRWFLQQVANGGFLDRVVGIPTADCPGGGGPLCCVHGVNHPEPSRDLGAAIKVEREWALAFDERSLGRYVPFGSHGLGGQVLIDMTGNVGRVVYNPRDPYEFYYSADSIRHFLDMLIREPPA